MKAFIWTMLILFALESIGKASWIASGRYPERTPGATVVDVVVGVLFAAWALWLLVGSES